MFLGDYVHNKKVRAKFRFEFEGAIGSQCKVFEVSFRVRSEVSVKFSK